MNYELILDEAQLRDFINWLPDLEADERFYGALFARKKYSDSSNQKKDKSQLKRFVTTKERLINKIKQLEVKKGTYTFNDIAVDENSLALYINPNPRNLKKATYNGILALTTLLRDDNKTCLLYTSPSPRDS